MFDLFAFSGSGDAITSEMGIASKTGANLSFRQFFSKTTKNKRKWFPAPHPLPVPRLNPPMEWNAIPSPVMPVNSWEKENDV